MKTNLISILSSIATTISLANGITSKIQIKHPFVSDICVTPCQESSSKNDQLIFDHAEISIQIPYKLDLLSEYYYEAKKEDNPEKALLSLRSKSQKYFESLKLDYIKDYGWKLEKIDDYNVAYPFITISSSEKITSDNIDSIVKNYNLDKLPKTTKYCIYNLYYHPFENGTPALGLQPRDSSFKAIKKTIAWSDIGYNLSSLPKIGILEGRIEGKNSSQNGYFSNTPLFLNDDKDIDNPSSQWSTSEHATYVSSIISGKDGLCKDSPLYCAICGVSSLAFSRLQWMARNGVRLVNRSFHTDSNYAPAVNEVCNKYNEFAKINLRTLIASSGNIRNIKEITAPGSSDNIITVGATDPQGTCLEDYSAFKTIRSDQAKPNLVAPGTMEIPYDKKERNGTSFSAPLVTSAVARLMAEYPDYRLYPWRIPALLQATANLNRFKTAKYYGVQTNFGFDDAYGSGLLNYQERRSDANNIADFQFNLENGLTEFKSEKIAIDKSSNLKISAFWYASASLTDAESVIFPDCSVSLYREDGTLISVSSGSNTNTDLMIVPNVSPGNYYIEIKRGKRHITNSTDFGAVAWRINQL